MRRFIEWDSIDVRVDGVKIAAMAREMVARDPLIEKLDLRFTNGLLRVEGSVRKFISIPFTVDITRFEAKGRFRSYLAAIPTYVVVRPHPALLGAARLLSADTLAADSRLRQIRSRVELALIPKLDEAAAYKP